ncbi:hypothetical protein [Allofournierella massiliensis]|uniref:Uncharacterized protein n=1 Tax=Allofournierella massiliensis TaxID=1650663 RepID=A0ABT7URQ8_9FIRM|nr:hypothetical protein [Fournierella massiliensis]MDM8201576.1 hypothetical protein [Fournierella massiliensis]
MKYEQLTAEQALLKGKELPFVFARCLSKVKFGTNTEQLEPEEILEARFFDSSQEIRLFRRQGQLEAACLTQEPTDDCLEEEYEIANQELFGQSFTISKYLKEDDDGQTIVEATRLTGWKGGK